MKLPDALEDYHQQIAQAEQNLLEDKRRLAELRQCIPQERFEDHTFLTWDSQQVRLSELFGDKEDLILIHNMGASCSYCTMWADGFNGIFDHLEDRAAFVVVSPDDPETQMQFALSRGWKFRLISAQGNSFNQRAGFDTPEGLMPGVSTFYKDKDGEIYRVSHAEFGPGDDFCSTWHFFDLLKGGAKGWEPKHHYTADA